MEYKKHSTITAIQHVYKGSFFFLYILLKRSMWLGKLKASTKKSLYDDNIHVKFLKGNVNFFAEYIFPFPKNAITNCRFPSFLKMTNVSIIFK